MSSSISSTEVIDTTVTSYAWSGATNDSVSIERVNGGESRRNYLPRPQIERGTNPGNRITGRSSSAWSTSGGASLEMDPTGTSNDTFLGLTPSGLVGGRRYTLSADIQVPVLNSGSFRSRRIVVYNAVEPTVESVQEPNVVGSTSRHSVTFTAPADPSTLILRLYNGSQVTGEIIRWDSPLLTDAGRSSSYFDGSGTASTVKTYASSRPLQVLGYESQRASANVFHDVIGRPNPDVTLRPAGPRTGTLSFLFASEADAAECERMHAGTSVLTIDDPELPTIAMPYVADGAISRQLDSDTRALWVVGVAFREVRP